MAPFKGILDALEYSSPIFSPQIDIILPQPPRILSATLCIELTRIVWQPAKRIN